LKIDPPEAELMSRLGCVASFAKYARSVLFKSEDILSQFFLRRKQRNNFYGSNNQNVQTILLTIMLVPQTAGFDNISWSHLWERLLAAMDRDGARRLIRG
jgi:hypothetical protein